MEEITLFGQFARAACVAILSSVLAACGGIGGGQSSPAQAQAGSGAPGPGRATISGTPGTTVAVGHAYTFQPVASAGNGNNVTFTATNLPGWLTLNGTTGRLMGTPQQGDVATYSGITLVASDGTTTASLGPFVINVVASGAGRATLSWLAPTQNTDGSALTDLTGYVVIYGSSPSELSQAITISNPSVTTYVVENLTEGTWHFAVQAVNANGVLSPNSGTASKTIG